MDNQSTDVSDTRLINYKKKGPNHALSFTVYRNCCVEFETNVEVIKDTLKISNKDVSEDYCWCDCCFSFDVTFDYSGDIKCFFIDGKEVFYNQKSLQKYQKSYAKSQSKIKADLEKFNNKIFDYKVKNISKVDLESNYRLVYKIYEEKTLTYAQGGVVRDSVVMIDYSKETAIDTGLNILLDLVSTAKREEAKRVINTEEKYLIDTKVKDLLSQYNQIISNKRFTLYEDLKNFTLKPLFGTVGRYKIFLALGNNHIVIGDKNIYPCGDNMCLFETFKYYEKIE